MAITDESRLGSILARGTRCYLVVLVGESLDGAYVLSYAIVYRQQVLQQNDIWPDWHWKWVYRPLQWCIDYTPLRKPLLKWAEVHHCRTVIEMTLMPEN